MTTNTPIYLLKDRRPDSCFVDQIYDPEVNGLPSENMAVVIPNEGAIAVDRQNGFMTYVVSHVDPITYKSTLVPIRLLTTEDDSEVIEILSYGNDKFMLFFDDRTRPTKLIVDAKLRLFGSALAEYRLVRTTATGTKEIISLYMNSNEEYLGDRIPLSTVTPGSSMKQCTNCHTLHVKRATILNDLASSTDVIVEFKATANQMDGDDFYIHQRQSVTNLVVSPELIYSDGVNEIMTVDNLTCFLYGLDDFIPAFPGQRQKVLIKKYLGGNQVSPLSQFDGRSRFLSLEKWVTVRANKALDGIKVSTIPKWNALSGKYDLQFVAYTDRRDRIFDVTAYTTIIGGYDGGLFNTQQKVILDVDLTTIFGEESTITYRQYVYITLKPFSQFQRYILQDNLEEPYVYGVESADMRRPVIHYDSTLQQYFIPTSRFANQEAFIEAFYKVARPPFDPDVEIEATPPTHFTIRNVDTLATIIASPIEISQYNQIWNILTPGQTNQYVNGQLIVEFLTNVSSEFQIIYGVPVDVHPSLTGYNTEPN